MPRKILHLDLDAFFCSVEELHNPALKGKPFAVGGKANQRGVVASCSYAARTYGIHSAMPMGQALQRCPELIVISSRHADYQTVSKQVMAIIEITPFIEKISIDEAFMDVTGLPEPLSEIASDLQGRVNQQIGLPISIGGAVNKLVAKIANDWGKTQKRSPYPPNAITIIPPGKEAQFLAPLPVRYLWGVGPKTADKLSQFGITTIGKLAQSSPKTLEILFGQYGYELQQRALGIDKQPINLEHEIKSVSNEVTFAQDVTNKNELLQTIRKLSEQVGRRLRKASLAGTTVHIKLRWSDFSTITRQATINSATNLDQDIYSLAEKLFEDNWSSGKPVRLVGVGVSNLGPPTHQFRLWEDDHEKKLHLVQAVDELRDRFGKDIIKRARQLRRQSTNQDQDSNPD